MRLKGKVSIITGGASGIGKATVLKFAQEGAIVAVCDLNQETIDATVNEVKGRRRRSRGLHRQRHQQVANQRHGR